MKKLSIISLKYSPGLLKEMIALSKAAQKDNYDVNLVINAKYKWLLKEANLPELSTIQFNNTLEILKIFKFLTKDKSRKIIFYNFHPANILIRLYKNSKNSFVYVHEPWMEDKHKYGIQRMAMVIILEILQKFYAIFTSEIIVVPSEHAKEKALQYGLNHRYSEVEVCPLMLDINKKNVGTKDSFLFIGRLHGAKAFDPVLNILKNDPSFKLKVLTTSTIPKSVLNDYKEEIKSKRLNIISKDNLGEEEIQLAIITSLAVLKLDTLMTQSGVVALSFALSTPVIARNILGFSQDIDHKHDGYLIEEDNSTSLIEATRWVSRNSNSLSINARDKYINKFSPESWNNNWGRLLNSIDLYNSAN